VLHDQLGIDDAAVSLSFAESFTGRDRTWHLATHFVGRGTNTCGLDLAEDLTEPAWYPCDAFPPCADVTHGGWALHTLERILRDAASAIS